MRLIDADKLYPDCMTKNGTLAISQSQIANAPTVDVDRDGEDRYNQAIKDVTEQILKMRTHYTDCTMCSISESIIGETVCDGVLRYLKEKEV